MGHNEGPAYHVQAARRRPEHRSPLPAAPILRTGPTMKLFRPTTLAAAALAALLLLIGQTIDATRGEATAAKPAPTARAS